MDKKQIEEYVDERLEEFSKQEQKKILALLSGIMEEHKSFISDLRRLERLLGRIVDLLKKIT